MELRSTPRANPETGIGIKSTLANYHKITFWDSLVPKCVWEDQTRKNVGSRSWPITPSAAKTMQN